MDLDTVSVLTVFIFGFTCQQNVFAITNELKDPTPPRVNSVIVRAVGLALTVYICVAVAGYGTFGSEVESDILTNYGTGPIVTVARFFVALLVCFSYPLQCHPSRMCITSIVRLLVPGSSEEGKACRSVQFHSLNHYSAARCTFFRIIIHSLNHYFQRHIAHSFE